MLVLRTAIGDYPHTAPLKDGRVRSERVALEHVGITPVNRAFRPMVNQLAYDVSEMALVTLMLAKSIGRPLRGLPVVLMRQSAHELLGVRTDAPRMQPRDLSGRRIGVRAYTQTTGTWIRGILQDQFGIDLRTLQWLTFEDAHVDGYVDPPSCDRARGGLTLQDALLQADVDAAVGLEPNPSWRPVIDDVSRAEAEWLERTGVTPLNHVVVVKEALAIEHPWLTRELFDVFCAARDRAGGNNPSGVEHIRAAVELLARYAFEQAIIPRAFRADEIFEPF